MKDYLYQKDHFFLFGIVEKKPSSMSDEKWVLLDRKALGIVRSYLGEIIDLNISKENTTKGIMDKLAKLYEKSLSSNKVFLMKRSFNMKMVEGGFIPNWLNEFGNIAN